MLLEGAGGGWGSTALAAVTTIIGPGGYVGGWDGGVYRTEVECPLIPEFSEPEQHSGKIPRYFRGGGGG